MAQAAEQGNKHKQVQSSGQSGGDSGTKLPGHLQNTFTLLPKSQYVSCLGSYSLPKCNRAKIPFSSIPLL